jgi:hypothetical protein
MVTIMTVLITNIIMPGSIGSTMLISLTGVILTMTVLSVRRIGIISRGVANLGVTNQGVMNQGVMNLGVMNQGVANQGVAFSGGLPLNMKARGTCAFIVIRKVLRPRPLRRAYPHR